MKKMMTMLLLAAAMMSFSVSASARPRVIQGKHATVVILNKDTHRKPLLCQHCAAMHFRDARFRRDARFARYDRRDVRCCKRCDRIRCERCGKKLDRRDFRR